MLRSIITIALVCLSSGAAALACGGAGADDTTGGSGTHGAGGAGAGGAEGCMTGGGGADTSACDDCVASKCDTLDAAVGMFCAAVTACQSACDCADAACMDACGAQADTTCHAAVFTLGSCRQTSCAAECASPSSSSSSGGALSPICAELAACCGKVPSNEQPSCSSVVGLGVDAACSTELMVLQNGGEC